ncbi:MAG: hypothetical protein IIY81_01060, partial [Lachnospiraceae bacterium]|nr:hypothetical protein [Lachnospiraceae bacterium]
MKQGKYPLLQSLIIANLDEVLQFANVEYYSVKGIKRDHAPQFTPSKLPTEFYPDKEGNIWIVF